MKQEITDPHNYSCHCDVCKHGPEVVRERELNALDKHGWYTHFIFGDDDSPFHMNIHTHGLKEKFNHLDLQICFPVLSDQAHSILITAIEDHIKKGEKYEAGQKYNGLIVNSQNDIDAEILFLEAEECGRPVLRMIFPDQDWSFSGELAEKQMIGCKIPEKSKEK